MFLYVFFLFNPPGAGMFQEQKDHFVPDVTQAEEIQKSASMELHKWSENVINVENRQFLKENCEFLTVIYGGPQMSRQNQKATTKQKNHGKTKKLRQNKNLAATWKIWPRNKKTRANTVFGVLSKNIS